MATVVVVDDQRQNCELVEVALGRVGIAVHAVTDARVAVERIVALAPDCVLLDQRMPHRTGIEVLAELRERFGPLDLPVVMMTAVESRETCHQAFAAGASDFVSKPFDVEELQHRVQAHVRNSEMRAELDRALERQAQQATNLERILDAVDVHIWVLDPATGAVLTRNGVAASAAGDRVWQRISGELVLDGSNDVLRQDRVHEHTSSGIVAHDVIRQAVTVDGRNCVVVAAYDATDQERARQALEQALRREQENLSARRDLDDMRARFLAATSHELRTPLTVLNGAVEVGARQAADPQLRELFGAAVRHARQLGDLVADVMTVSAGGAGVARLRPIGLASVLRSVLEQLQIEQIVHVDVDEATTVVGDRALLTRALKALVDNAHRHGSGPRPVRISASSEQQWVRCRIEDSGPGLRPELFDDVFEPFVQGDETVDHRPGPGIGLTVARLLVQAHGGEIRLGRSVVLGGLQVEVDLPRQPAEGMLGVGDGADTLISSDRSGAT